MTQLSQILTAEVSTYLEVIDTIRDDGNEPVWKAEESELRNDPFRPQLSKREIRAEVIRHNERMEQ